MRLCLCPALQGAASDSLAFFAGALRRVRQEIARKLLSAFGALPERLKQGRFISGDDSRERRQIFSGPDVTTLGKLTGQNFATVL